MKKKITNLVLFGFLFLLASQPAETLASAVDKDAGTGIKESEIIHKVQDSQKIYGIASVSKMFGATAVMKLVDEGKVELDAPVTDYIPDFKMADERYRQITVRMLLNHSSGIMGTTEQGFFLMGESNADYRKLFLESIAVQRLKADPGEFSVYCNDGFTLAEIIVERVSGMSFGKYIQEVIAKPLGMKDTGAPADIENKEDFAPIYYKDRQLPFENVQSLASGGIYSTPEDLCRFSQIFLKDGNGFLSKEAVSAMAFPEYKNNQIGVQEGDSNFGYGLGWDSVEAYPFSEYGITALMKGGDTGYSTSFVVLPEQNLSAAVTASGGNSQYCQIMAQEIITEVLKEEGLLTKEQETTTEISKTDANKEGMPIPEELAKYEGIYASSGMFQIEFTDVDTLRITSLENNSDMVQEYIYTKDGTFVSTNGKYISFNGLSQTAGGISGVTSFYFREEANERTYMMGTSYTVASGRAQSALTAPLAEKVKKSDISAETARAWEARNGKKYYLVSDTYNSNYNIKVPFVKVETLKSLKGYTGAPGFAKNCRIVDEDNAVCELKLPIMVGRDLTDYHFYREGETEYLNIGGSTFQSESAVKDSAQMSGDVILGTMAQWYQVDETDAGNEIQIEVPENGAYYIFDEYDICSTASLFQDEKKTVLFPKKGKILLVGEEGSLFHIRR